MGLYERNLAPPLINLVRGTAPVQTQRPKTMRWAGLNYWGAAQPR